jgi:glutathione-dependent peroxiredoxin
MFYNHEGQHVPPVTFRMILRILGEVVWYNLSAAELFADKSIVVFAVPGAFVYPNAPLQLLAYNNAAEIFRSHGVDEILCMAVNDPFSLANWAQAEGIESKTYQNK